MSLRPFVRCSYDGVVASPAKSREQEWTALRRNGNALRVGRRFSVRDGDVLLRNEVKKFESKISRLEADPRKLVRENYSPRKFLAIR
jgi:hypothetical protein